MGGLYSKARGAFLGADLDWDGDTIKAVLVDTDEYVVDLANDQYLADIPSEARVATSPALTGKTLADGVADADDITFPTVTGATSEAIVLFADTANPATSRLIVYIDSGSGLPYIPNGADVVTVWDNGPLKIFRL
jgi:hypothetical protein